MNKEKTNYFIYRINLFFTLLYSKNRIMLKYFYFKFYSIAKNIVGLKMLVKLSNEIYNCVSQLLA